MRTYFRLPNPVLDAKVYQVRDKNGIAFSELTSGDAAKAFKDARDKFGGRARSVALRTFKPSLG